MILELMLCCLKSSKVYLASIFSLSCRENSAKISLFVARKSVILSSCVLLGSDRCGGKISILPNNILTPLYCAFHAFAYDIL